MEDFNKALLGKLGWTVVTYQDKIWVQLLKSKYLRGKKGLPGVNNQHGCGKAYDSRYLVLKGAFYEVKSGMKVNI
jgi:hypothetical protein